MSEVRIEVLGPVRARVDGVEQRVGGRRERVVLGLLAASAGRPVPVERLVDTLWGEEAPASAQGSLQVAVSRLRTMLAPERRPGEAPVISRSAAGYALVEAEVDAAELSAAASAVVGRGPAEVAELTEAALALWQGEPYADLRDVAVLDAEVTRLHEDRLRLYEARTAALLDLGRHDEAQAVLATLVEENPFRERLWSLLAVALYRCDRQAEALETLRRLRTTLADELGVDPSPSVRTLEEDLLAQAPHLAAPAGPGQGTPVAAAADDATRSLGSGVVGRSRVLAALDDALDRLVTSGRGGVTVLTGEAGIGKSMLSAEVGRRARRRGVRVAVGRCHEADLSPAYWPWLPVLRAVAGPDPEPEVALLVGRPGRRRARGGERRGRRAAHLRRRDPAARGDARAAAGGAGGPALGGHVVAAPAGLRRRGVARRAGAAPGHRPRERARQRPRIDPGPRRAGPAGRGPAAGAAPGRGGGRRAAARRGGRPGRGAGGGAVATHRRQPLLRAGDGAAAHRHRRGHRRARRRPRRARRDRRRAPPAAAAARGARPGDARRGVRRRPGVRRRRGRGRPRPCGARRPRRGLGRRPRHDRGGAGHLPLRARADPGDGVRRPPARVGGRPGTPRWGTRCGAASGATRTWSPRSPTTTPGPPSLLPDVVERAVEHGRSAAQVAERRGAFEEAASLWTRAVDVERRAPEPDPRRRHAPAPGRGVGPAAARRPPRRAGGPRRGGGAGPLARRPPPDGGGGHRVPGVRGLELARAGHHGRRHGRGAARVPGPRLGPRAPGPAVGQRQHGAVHRLRLAGGRRGGPPLAGPRPAQRRPRRPAGLSGVALHRALPAGEVPRARDLRPGVPRARLSRRARDRRALPPGQRAAPAGPDRRGGRRDGPGLRGRGAAAAQRLRRPDGLVAMVARDRARRPGRRRDRPSRRWPCTDAPAWWASRSSPG